MEHITLHITAPNLHPDVWYAVTAGCRPKDIEEVSITVQASVFVDTMEVECGRRCNAKGTD